MNKLKDVPYYVDDNFVPLEIQNQIEFNILNDEQDFPWYYSSTTVYKNNQYEKILNKKIFSKKRQFRITTDIYEDFNF